MREILDALNWIVAEHPLTASDVQESRLQLGSQAWNDLFKKQLSRRLGVVSFASTALHPLLWAHYADSGAGIAIGYRASILSTIATGYQRLGAVRYLEEPPVSMGHAIFQNERNLHEVLLSKASYWKYEQEWRLTLELRNTVGTGNRDSNGYSVNLCPIPNEAVTEVYFAERTPTSVIDTIQARLKGRTNRFGADVPRSLTLAANKYGYDI